MTSSPTSEARCAVDVAPIRREPSENAEQVTQALLGEPLVLGDRRDGWVAVTTGYGYPGWMRPGEVEPGTGTYVADLAGTPLDAARAYLGSPYLWGGMSEAGIDCSGLVHLAYRRLGRLVPPGRRPAAGRRDARGGPRPGRAGRVRRRRRRSHRVLDR